MPIRENSGGKKEKKKGFFFMTLTKCHIENDTVMTHPLILPENMLLKSANFMYFVVTMYHLPKQHALRTQATYTTKALALQRARRNSWHFLLVGCY